MQPRPPAHRNNTTRLPPQLRRKIIFGIGIGVSLLFGLLLGISISESEPTAVFEQQIATLSSELKTCNAKSQKLERTLTYQQSGPQKGNGKALSDAVRNKIKRGSSQYISALKKAKHHSAADLIRWFTKRWINLLDSPQPNDRLTRRAALLRRVIGAMRERIHPGDYVSWQLEFLRQPWLAEINYDIDGDNYPTTLRGDNPRDGFTRASICHIAMALNQTATNLYVLVTPEMECEKSDDDLSLFLSGKTVAQAAKEFTQVTQQAGYVIVSRRGKNMQQILISPKRK